MMKVDEKAAEVVRKIFELHNRGFTENEIAVILNNSSVIKGIIYRLDHLFTMLENYNISINYDIDYEKILETREEKKIEDIFVNQFIKYKDELGEQDISLRDEIDFVIRESKNIYNNDEKIMKDSKKLFSNGKFGYELDKRTR